MGEPDEQPVHEVTLSAYCIDRTEVTVKAHASCVDAGVCTVAPGTVNWRGYSPGYVKRYSRFCNREDRPDHPINCIDWDQAVAYCKWTGGRLPTEAEWEYAARGTDGRLYPWGNEAPTATKLNACGAECAAVVNRDLGGRLNLAKFDVSDGYETTAPVGSFPDGASPFGVLDMAGNVWEWTADWFGPYSGVAATNPQSVKTSTVRVQRGGGWNIGFAADYLRAAYRMGGEPSDRLVYVGFRCARGG